MRLAPALLALLFAGCANGSGAHQHPGMSAPMGTTGSGLDPNFVAEMPAADGSKPAPLPKSEQLETKVVTADPEDPTSMHALASLLLGGDWILVRKEAKSPGVNVYTFIRPASTRVGLDGVGKPDVSKRDEDGSPVPVPVPTPLPK